MTTPTTDDRPDERDPAAPAGARPSAAVRRRRRTGRVVLVVALVFVVVVLALGWVAFRAVQAAAALQDAQQVLGDASTDVTGGDLDALEAALPAAQDATERARAASSDPVWSLAQHLPWLGEQLRAVRTVSVAADDLAQDAVPTVVEVSRLLTAPTMRSDDGRLDVATLAQAAPRIQAAADVAQRAHEQVVAIRTDRLVGRLAGPVRTVDDGLGRVAAALEGARKVSALLPGMLGADGERTYLVLALNSAELRAAGGIVGTVVEVHADDGRLSLGRTLSTADLRPLADPVLPLGDAETALYGERLGRWVQNAVSSPDFPRAAQLVAARWERETGNAVDGVVATDPVAVADLLGVLGAVRVEGGPRLTQDNLVEVLLHDAYLTFPDPADADAYFGRVAAAVFGDLTTGRGDTVDLLRVAGDATADGRVRVWSAHEDEQREIAGTVAGAAFLSGEHADATGVFLDDATTGKLDLWLRSRVTVEDLRCTGDEPTATVRLELSYDPPADVASFPTYVTGSRGDDIPRGSLVTTVTAYAPQGAPLGGIRRGTAVVSAVSATEGDRAVQAVQARLEPGGSQEYSFDVPVRDGRVEVWTTPTTSSTGYVTATCGDADGD